MYYDVELLDDPDIDYTDLQEDLLEHALEYLDHRRYAKAEELLSKLLDSTSDTCFVAAYNLGVIKELTGDLTHARELYILADTLTKEPNEVLDSALARVRSSIYSREQAIRQIEQ
jgi:Flp pilus assembly protein TadD